MSIEDLSQINFNLRELNWLLYLIHNFLCFLNFFFNFFYSSKPNVFNWIFFLLEKLLTIVVVVVLCLAKYYS